MSSPGDFGMSVDKGRRVQPFIDRFGEFSSNLAALLETMVFFVAPLAEPQRTHRRLEAAIVDQLYGAEPPSIRFQDPGMRVHRRRENEPPLDVSSTPTGLFRGLPDHFSA